MIRAMKASDSARSQQRLDRFLSHASPFSRKEVRRLLHASRVTVNGEVVKKSDRQVDPEQDIVELDGQRCHLARPRYLMLHKPYGVVCANTDGEHPTVMDLLDNPEGLSVAGRLDLDTTGLVLLSDDGDWIHRIISPRRSCQKTYLATLDGKPDQSVIDQFASGIMLRSEKHPTAPASLAVIGQDETGKDYQVEVTLIEGRYHQVKRMFAACGLKVLKLHRLRIGHVVLDSELQEGQSRYLSEQEVSDVFKSQVSLNER